MVRSRVRRRPRVLVVDDDPVNVDIFARVLAAQGLDVTRATGGEEALGHLAREVPDLVLLDVMMPGVDGYQVCHHIKSNPETWFLPVLMISGYQGQDEKIKGVEAGADGFLAKPPDWRELTARVKALLRFKQYTERLESAESVILSLGMTIELRDPYTEGHCQRLAHYATAVGAHLGLPDDDLEALYRGGFLHDLGKIGIPDAVLLKAGTLDAAERALLHTHPVLGARLCHGLRSLRRALPIIRSHHERLDGTGYPDGLAGDAVPLLAQIMSVVDVYDALTTERPYRPALPRGRAHRVLLEEADRNWRSPSLVREFIDLDRRHALDLERLGVHWVEDAFPS